MKPDTQEDSELESLFKEAAGAFFPPHELRQTMRNRLFSQAAEVPPTHKTSRRFSR